MTSDRRSAETSTRLHQALPLLVAGSMFSLYLATLAPGIEFGDCGEIITTSTLLWVPHPSGYPLYVLLGHLFSRLPIGADEAHRLNIMSALFCTLALGVFGYWLKQILSLACLLTKPTSVEHKKDKKKRKRKEKGPLERDDRHRPAAPVVSESMQWLLASFGTAFLGLSRPYWILSTSAEVYPLYLILLAGNLCLFTRYVTEMDSKQEGRIGVLWSFVLGLTFSCHLSTSLLAPVFLIAFFARHRSWAKAGPRLIRLVIPFILGLSPYIVLPLIGLRDPPFNWLYPLSFAKFVEHVSGARYHEWLGDYGGFKRNLAIFVEAPAKFGYLGVGLSLMGFLWLVRRRMQLAALSSIAFLTCFAYAITYKSVEIEPFFLHCYIVLAVWGVFGVLALRELLPRLPQRWLFATVVPAVLLASLVVNLPEADRSENQIPEELVRNMVGDALPNAVIFSNDFFRFQAPLMYLHYVRGFRPDVTDVEVAILSEPFYLRTLEKHHPDLFTHQMRELRQSLANNPMTREEYQKTQIAHIVRRVHPNRPVYFENTVKHDLVPDGFKVIPQGMLYRLFPEAEDVPPPGPPRAYPFHDVHYVDYQVDKARNNYVTMMYANGIWAERRGKTERARQYYEYAVRFFPDCADRVSSDDEGRALRKRRSEVLHALSKLSQRPSVADRASSASS